MPLLSAQPRERALPLSFAQERLWFLEQLYSLGASYHEATVFRLEGNLNVVALERSFLELTRRHESLRTRFATAGGDEILAVVAPAAFQLGFADLTTLNVKERGAEAKRLIQAETEQPFDIERGPLFRVSVLRLAAQEHIMLVTMHHIISDDWSMRNVLPQQLRMLYTAFSQGLPSTRAFRAVGDYALWQREWLQGNVLERQLAYWRERLSGAEALELPTDYPRPPVPSFKGARVAFAASSELSVALTDLARRRGAALVHDLAGGVPAVTVAMERTARHYRGIPDRRPQPSTDRRFDRILRDNLGAAHGFLRQPKLLPVAGSGQGDGAGGL